MTHDPNDPTILKAALCEAIDRADAAEHQLREARTQVEELEEERDNLRELAEAGYGAGVADTHVAKRPLIREWQERAESAETQLKRCQEALRDAADDLGKAANQFASIRASQEAGHNPEIIDNPEIFEAKETKARSALSQQSEPNTPEGE